MPGHWVTDHPERLPARLRQERSLSEPARPVYYPRACSRSITTCTLYLRLLDQAHAVATYLIADEMEPDADDDRDALERAADHVAVLAGYQGADACDVSDALWRGLRKRMGVPDQHAPSLTE